MGILVPRGPDFAVLGLARTSVAWQALGLVAFFVVGTIGAMVGEWVAGHVQVRHAPSSGK